MWLQWPGSGKRAAVVGDHCGRPVVGLLMSGVPIAALVDTGASCCLLRQDKFREIIARNHRVPLLRRSPLVQGITGKTLDLCGQTELSIDGVKMPIQVLIARELPHEMVLSSDALHRGHGVIDLAASTLRWHGKSWSLSPTIGRQVSSVGSLLPASVMEEINSIICENKDVFSEKGQPNGRCNLTPMTIQVTGPPISQRAYRTPLSKRLLVEEAVREMLDDGVIRPSRSPWASPITLVPKKDGTTRFCVDYRKLNDITVKDTYPLPLIQDIFDQVGGRAVYSTLDLKSGYWQLPVAAADIHKTAFRCHLGLFEFMKTPFGLANAPSVFQRTMDQVLAGLIGKCVFVYIDDILVYSDSVEDHKDHLQQVFDRLRQHGLRLKPSKCAFGLPEVKVLGYVLSAEGVTADPDKVSTIVDLPQPRSVRDIRSFLGMTGYYRHCMPEYARVAEPLLDLTRKHSQFKWSDKCTEGFQKLKDLLVSSYVMAAPDTTLPYKLYTDACDYSVGAILVQEHEDGVERVIHYLSHALSPAQRRWAVIEREAYAVIYAIQKLRPYLYGSRFTIYTDHKPLKSLFTKEMANTKIQRWSVLLAEYGAEIKYREGKNNVRADMLSRIRHTPEQVAVLDTEEWVDPDSLKDEGDQEASPWQYDGLDMQAVAKEQRNEYPTQWDDGLDSENENYDIINGVLFSSRPPNDTAATYPRLLLPSRYHQEVISRAHKEVGHMAYWKTSRRLIEAYVWPRLRSTVKKFITKCPVCLTHNRRPQRHPMGEMPTANYPMQIVGADLIGPLPESLKGNKYALVMVDHCTGWAEAFPLKDKTNKSVWEAFSNHFVSRHGVPEVLITDNGGEFTALEWEQYLQDLGVDHHRTTPVHPQSNGKTERCNRTLKEILQKLVNNQQHQWEDRLGEALMAHRISVSTTTGHSPFYLMYGRHGRVPLSKTLQTTSEQTFGNRLDDLAKALKLARTATEDSRHHNRERLRRQAREDIILQGDSVVVKADDRMPFTCRWDPHWQVYRVNKRAVWIRHQQTGRARVVNREKVRLADPTVSWDDHNARPIRNPRRARRLRQQPVQQEPDDQQEQLHPRPIYKLRPQPINQEQDETANDAAPPPANEEAPVPCQQAHKRSRPISRDEEEDAPPAARRMLSQRRGTLSYKAQQLAEDSESDMEADPEASYFRKRRQQKEEWETCPQSEKRARCFYCCPVE